jgi:ABC-2 type transport system permease protein
VTAAARDAGGSVIHDIGYKPYLGARHGRAHIVRSLYWFSLRSAFGFGRGARARIIPLFCFGAMLLPAAASIYRAAATGAEPVIRYSRYGYTTALLLIVFVAVAAPELVSRDLRHHTLPLYFCRPLRRADYPLAKLLALATAILLFEALPLLTMYLGTIASATTGSRVWAETRDLVPGLIVAAVYAIAFAPVTLFFASLTGRRAIATGAIAILFLATNAVSGVLESVDTRSAATTGDHGAIGRDGGLVNPMRLVEGTRIWALHATDGAITDPESSGPLYGGELLLLTGLATGGLFLRYRRVGVA